MSWMSSIADKAENILNKIDQNAATALTLSPTSGGDAKMRKSVSSGSLRSSSTPLLPSRTGNRPRPSGVSSAGVGSSAKSEGGGSDNGSFSEGKWNELPQPLKSTSRRSSTSAKAADAVTIEIGLEESSDVSAEETMSLMEEAVQMSSSQPCAESQELAAFKIALNEVSSERDELRLRLSALNRDIENAGLKQRAQELEFIAQSLTVERDHIQQELRDTLASSSGYVHSISELETSLAKMQQEYLEVAEKLQLQARETEQQRQELLEYRAKAQRALQLKDKLIAELKTNGGAATEASSESVLQIELDALKHEHQHSLQHNASLSLQLEELRRDWNALATQNKKQLIQLQLNEEALRKELRIEREHVLALESEQRVLTQELQTLRNQMAATATRLQEKEHQLQQQRNDKRQQQLKSDEDENGVTAAAGSFSNTSTRLKALTQALVDKQNSVEYITAERNALRIQLEKMQDQLQQSAYKQNVSVTLGIPTLAPRNALLLNSTDDVKSQFPLLMQETPFDNRVARRVKRAYSTLDSAGIRLGAFLRRYPLMRIFVLMYVAMLHIWVMFVLLSSTPN